MLSDSSSTNELTDLNLLFIAVDLEFLQIGERIRTKSIGSLIILQRGERVRTKRIGSLKGVFAKNERGYRLDAIKKRF